MWLNVALFSPLAAQISIKLSGPPLPTADKIFAALSITWINLSSFI